MKRPRAHEIIQRGLNFDELWDKILQLKEEVDTSRNASEYDKASSLLVTMENAIKQMCVRNIRDANRQNLKYAAIVNAAYESGFKHPVFNTGDMLVCLSDEYDDDDSKCFSEVYDTVEHIALCQRPKLKPNDLGNLTLEKKFKRVIITE